uniref:C2 DOCK-type domain-containing protein n=1 Tax=Heligmosomoides polygyrus TaxID=6339 RepID=A0A8L8KTG6_HELPZ
LVFLQLTALFRTEKTSKSIIPRGSVGVRIDVIVRLGRVNPSYFALKPWSLSDDSPVAPVFELQTFNDRVFQPHSDFVLQAFYNRLDPTGPLTLSAKCAVQYHQQYPLFGDEIKLRLPINLSKGDHILFSFSHIAVGGQPNSKLSESVETPIGYAFLPLMFSAHTLMLDSDEQDISLPVAAELPAMSWRSGPHYDFNNIDKSMDLVKWVDPRPLFRFRMRLVSSIFTSEVLTQATFHVRFTDRFVLPHSSLAVNSSRAAVAVQGDSFDSAALFRQLWFFFDVMAKSIAQTIVRRSVLKVVQRARLPLDVMEQIGIVVANLVPLLISKHNAMPNECHTGITCIAYFLRCCLSFIDRGAVFKWMNFIIQQLEECDSKVARDYKLDVITIISQHEHWLPLCLPVVIDSQNQIHRVVNQPLSSEYRQHAVSFISHIHFLQELYASMLEPREYRHRVISLVRNLLAKHSFDKRYLDMNIQRRIAVLYIPLIRFALDHCGEMEDVINDFDATRRWRFSLSLRLSKSGLSGYGVVMEKGTKIRCLLGRLHGAREPLFLHEHATHAALNPAQGFGWYVFLPPNNPAPNPPQMVLTVKTKEEVQDILVSVLYVIHRVPKRILGVLCMDMKKCSAMQLLNLLDLALNVFRYRGRPEPKPAAEKTSRDLASLQPSKYSVPTSCTRSSCVALLFDKLMFIGRPDAPFRALQLLNLSQEVALIVLEVCQSLAHEFMVSLLVLNMSTQYQFILSTIVQRSLFDVENTRICWTVDWLHNKSLLCHK